MAQAATSRASQAPVESLDVAVFEIPTETPESDGTYEWNRTTLVLVEAGAAGEKGIGYTYADSATGVLIRNHLREVVLGKDAMNPPAMWDAMVHSIRNLGRPGISSMAISAVDFALWDLKARLLQLPLVALLGAHRGDVPAYGSGGFTSYSDAQLQKQLGGWAEAGLRFVKMKIGREPERDPERVRAARKAIGAQTSLFVDANGAYSRKQALALSEVFAQEGVTWFEEPVSSDDLAGLRLMRDRAPAGMEIAAGEYGYDIFYFRRMLEAGAVDVLQADATRCGGITGFLQVASLCHGFSLSLSAHTAPTLHVPLCCAAPGNVRHIEYFFDHQRIEHMLFEGAAEPSHGNLLPNTSSPGFGIALKKADAAKFAA